MTAPTYNMVGDSKGEAAAIIEVAQAACEPTGISSDPAILLVTNQRDGTAAIIDAQQTLDQYADRPRRKKGTARLTTGESFGRYVEQHADDKSTALYADETSLEVVAVINGHVEGAGADMAGWADHRALFTIRRTPAWEHWIRRDGVIGSQQDFAEHIDARVIDITTPEAATMLEIAQSFQATATVEFKEQRRLQNGERQFTFNETIASKAGEAGNLEVPERFTLTIAPFEGAHLVDVEARLLTRLRDGKLNIGYALTRPEDVAREAFESVVSSIEEQTGYSIYRGTPPA